MSVRIGSMFTGYGGLEMGLERAGLDCRTVWHAETDSLVNTLLTSHGRNLGDVRDVEWSRVSRVGMLVAGFPCQPVSAAGGQAGDLDPRWLWPEVLRAVDELQPRRVFVENVRNLIAWGRGRLWSDMLDDLRVRGYGIRWLTMGACAVGAAHHRHRVFALATAGSGEGAWRMPAQECGAREAVFPTPTTRDGDGRGTGDRRYWTVRQALRTNGVPLDVAVAMLPTPRATDGTNGGPGQRHGHGGLALPSAVQPDHWGAYAEAVRRHSKLYGRPPRPTEPNSNGAPRLTVDFAEWLMCLPAGHVSSKLPRLTALKAIGNGACPPQVARAFTILGGA